MYILVFSRLITNQRNKLIRYVLDESLELKQRLVTL